MPPIRYSVEMIRSFSPGNFGIMEFRSEADYQLCTKIRGEHPLLKQLGHQFRREFHMTEDAHFFHKLGARKPAGTEMVLFEGKMIHQFESHFAPASYCVVEKEVREELLRKEIFRLAQFVRDSGMKMLDGKPIPARRDDLSDLLQKIFEKKGLKLQYESDRLAYRAVASSTNERTLIASIVPEAVCMGHSLYYLSPFAYEIHGGEWIIPAYPWKTGTGRVLGFS